MSSESCYCQLSSLWIKKSTQHATEIKIKVSKERKSMKESALRSRTKCGFLKKNSKLWKLLCFDNLFFIQHKMKAIKLKSCGI